MLNLGLNQTKNGVIVLRTKDAYKLYDTTKQTKTVFMIP